MKPMFLKCMIEALFDEKQKRGRKLYVDKEYNILVINNAEN